MSADYSQVASDQLDALEQCPDPGLYSAVLDTIDLIFRVPGQAQALSTAITTADGIRMRLPVIGHPPFKVFWSTDGPRIEAVFPHPG
ncbi:hypothetical protein AB4Z39_05105 [Mycobacterium adipatum]|uniref:hypothetical protein n=1 Tax=Mycobacterium adipatum TaxID=1682113 RepID=UPI0034E08DB9